MNITQKTKEHMETKEYQEQLANSYEREVYDDTCPNEENKTEVEENE